MAKTILITGALGGMGRATCELLMEKGYTVWGLDYVERDIPDGLNFIKADLTDEASVAAAYEKISAKTQSISAIIHMAGMYDAHSLVEMSEQRFLKMFEVNVFSAYRINRIFLPLLRKGSRILLTSSELGPLDPLPFTGIYGITKSTLEKYAFSLRTELALLGIHVTVRRPGAVKTGLLSVSTDALDKFCTDTELYKYNAKRFRGIVDKVESRNIPPEKIASLAYRALRAKRPRYVYSINRNPLLLLLDALPARLHVKVIGMILK